MVVAQSPEASGSLPLGQGGFGFAPKAEGKDPRPTKPLDKAQRNFTDPESKIQTTSFR